MATISSKLLESASQISTDFRCDNCHVTISQIRWDQCNKCHKFDLCNECAMPGYKLLPVTCDNHKRYHQSQNLNDPIDSGDIQSISVEEAETFADNERDRRTEEAFQRIMDTKRIENDYEMSIVTSVLKKNSAPFEVPGSELCSMILGYHTQAYETDIRVLSLDGGGIRGYMPIQVLFQLIKEQHLSEIKDFDLNNSEHRERFKQAQHDFKNRFDYIAGTSTGALIAFCLAVNYDIIDISKIYANSSYYFDKNVFGPLLRAKYDPGRIHDQIDKIIGTIQLKDGKRLDAKDATLLDLHNFLNPDHMITSEMMTGEKLSDTLISHGNWLEFIDGSVMNNPVTTDQGHIGHRIKREKVLLITAYSTTADSIAIFNTSYAKHWSYLIADVLKATMAAPTYFPPHQMQATVLENGHYVQDQNANHATAEIFIDGGVFANDPELAALWAIRMQWKKLLNYRVLSIGTGAYNTKLKRSTWGGITGWIINDGGGVLINTLMDATRSLTEVLTSNLAKFNHMKRMKFNYKLAESMNLDDPDFVEKFDKEWKILQKEDDYQALTYFYKKYINNKK